MAKKTVKVTPKECETTEAKKETGKIKVKFMRYKNIVLVETLSLPERFEQKPDPYIPLITVGNNRVTVCHSLDARPYGNNDCYLIANGLTPVHIMKYDSLEEAEKAIKKFSTMIRGVNRLDELGRTGHITESETEEVEAASFDATVIAQ